MAGKRKLTLENSIGCWPIEKGVDKGRFGWEFRPVDENGKYYIRGDGKPFRMGGKRSTLEDAQASYYNAVAELEKLKTGGRSKPASNQTLEQWSEYCLTTLWPTAGRGGGELDNRRSILQKHFYPTLRDTPLEAVTMADIRAVVSKIDGAWDTKRNVRNCASALFVSAMQEFPDAIKQNPALVDIGEKPKRDAEGNRLHERRFLDATEREKLLEVAKGDTYWIGIYLALNLGLRRGEILALKWIHVDWEDKIINVRDSIRSSKAGGKVTRPTKTVAGNRRIPLPNRVISTLVDHKATLGKDQIFIMPSSLGARAAERKFSRAMEDFRILAGLCGSKNRYHEPLPDPTLQDLRDTFCDMMANEKKVNVKVLQRIMGHERVETTLNFYVDADHEDLAAAMALLDD